MTLPIAVLTLTRDRLDYTRHCFQRLHEFAGCEFDHFVLDQGSSDGSSEWVGSDYFAWGAQAVILEPENIGRPRGLNRLIQTAFEHDDYDVVVLFDNDCELIQPNTLRDVAQLAHDGGCILSPRILGLRQPPGATRELRIGDETILDIPQIGGIFFAAPGWVFHEFRFNEANPRYGRDDVDLCQWWRAQGGTCGYVKRLEAWHYETTDGQHERYPEYEARKMAEMEADHAALRGAA